MAHAALVSFQHKLQQLLKGNEGLYADPCQAVSSWHAFLDDSLSKRDAPEAVEYLEQRIKCFATELLHSIKVYELEKRSPSCYPKAWKDFLSEVVIAGSDSMKEYVTKVMNARDDIYILPTRDSVRSCSEHTPHLQANVFDVDNNLVNSIKDRLIGPPSKLDVVSIVGMGGIGKTTLARQVYEDNYMEHYFYIRAWISVSQTPQLGQMLLDILRCFSSINDHTYLKSNEELAEQVYRSLKGRRYLIVMDDAWYTNAWDDVRRCFPDDKNGSRIILTSRLANVGIYASSSSPPHYMQCLSVEQSLKLFTLKVFKMESCPLSWKVVQRKY